MRISMPNLRKFLIVDDELNSRFLISKTLLRHYPNAVVQECQELDTALEVVRALPASDHHTVVIAHRTARAEGKEVVAALRAVHPSVPIVWTGKSDQMIQTKSVGATRFLDEQAWLLIGQTVQDLI